MKLPPAVYASSGLEDIFNPLPSEWEFTPKALVVNPSEKELTPGALLFIFVFKPPFSSLNNLLFCKSVIEEFIPSL
jgi:hypothetical protein